MATEIPYKWITGLPDEAQREIERNFLHMQGQIVAGSTTLDALIDSSLTASDAGLHKYKNLTDLAASETFSSTHPLQIGVVPRSTPITETGNISVSGSFSMTVIAPSPTSTIAAGILELPQSWDLAGHSIAYGAYDATIEGLYIYSSTGTGLTPFITGSALWLKGCTVTGVPTPYVAGTRTISSVSNGPRLYAQNCSFIDLASIGSAATTVCWDSILAWLSGAIATPTLTLNSGTYLLNCSVQANGVSNATISCAQTGTVVADLYQAPSYYGGGGILAAAVSITGTGSTSFNIVGNSALQPSWAATVAAGAGDTALTGDGWRGVTVSGNTNTKKRLVDVACNMASAGVFDITGPAQVTAHLRADSGSTVQAVLRGAMIHADLWIAGTLNPYVKLVACTDSFVSATLVSGGAGSQAYTIDAASARCVLVLAGSTSANMNVAATNAGTNCYVITDAGASPTGTAAGDLSGTYPNPTVAKIQGSSIKAAIAPTDGQVLKYDGTNTRWDAAELASTAQTMTAKSGVFNLLGSTATAGSAHGFAVRAMPVFFPKACTVSDLGIELTTVGEAGSYVILGIYNDTGSFYPGTLLGSTAHIATAAGAPAIINDTTPMTPIVIPKAGVYWIVSGVSTTGAGVTSPTFRAVNNIGMAMGAIAALGADLTTGTVCYTDAVSGGVLKATFTATLAGGGAMPRMYIKIQ